MARKTKADFDAEMALIQEKMEAEVKVEQAKIEAEQALDGVSPIDKAKIKSLVSKFNVNQIASMLMIPKHIVEKVLSQE